MLIATPLNHKHEMAGPVITVAPANSLVLADEFKKFARSAGAGKDADRFLDMFIDAATTLAERYVGRAFLTQTQKIMLDRWPEQAPIESNIPVIQLPNPPLASVVSITTYDTNDDDTVMSADDYQVDIVGEPGNIYIKEPASSLRATRGIEIVYTCGYGAESKDVPAPIVLSVMEWARDMYIKRAVVNEVPESVATSLNSYKLIM